MIFKLRYPLHAICSLLLGIVFISSQAYADNIIEGQHYVAISPPVKTQTSPEQIEVREFFWYGCPHCYSLEPHIEKWEKPKNVAFIRTPAILGKRWVVHAYTFYALKYLNRLDLHAVLFDALHSKEKRRLSTVGELATFFAQHGVNEKEFKDAFESFLIKTKIKQAQNLARKYKLSGVPTFVIAGKYMTSPSMTGSSYKNFFHVIDHLVAKVQKELTEES